MKTSAHRIASIKRVARRHLANIEHPIRHFNKFTQIYAKKLHDQAQIISSLVSGALQKYSRLDRDDQDTVSQYLRFSRDDMEMFLTVSAKVGAIAASIQEYDDAKLDWVSERFEQAARLVKEYRFVDRWEYEQDGVDAAVRNVPEAAEIFTGMHNAVTKTLDLRPTLDFITKRHKETQSFYAARGKDTYTKDETVPQTEKIETLYHVSVNAKTLAQKGFDPRGSSGPAGLGGGDRNLISFTSDFFVAKEISRAFQEATLIARGELRFEHIMSWAENEGIWEKLKDSMRIENIRDPAQVFRLYNHYLSFSNRRKKGGRVYNPVFVVSPENLMRVLQNKSPRDVGIMICKVDMTNPRMMYFSAEREFRVPAEAVLSIDRVITPHGSL